MKYTQIQNLSKEEFRRLTGIKRSTYDQIIKILSQANQIKKNKGGRTNKLSIENQLLMALEYLREYRTYFHIGTSYDVSESTAYKIIKWVENVLIKHPLFALPGKKALLKSDIMFETILIDATESPIERPKKKQPLTKDDKLNNKPLAIDRVMNENVIAALKKFKVISDRYRNRRKRFGLRFNLIAGIYSLELV